MIHGRVHKPQSLRCALLPTGGERRCRAFGVVMFWVAALILGAIAPASSDADPGCPPGDFRDPSTHTCVPYVTTGPVPVGEDAFLSESATLFAGSTGDDILKLGHSICQAIARGRSLSDIAQQLVSNGVDKTSAVHVVANARKLLCPPS